MSYYPHDVNNKIFTGGFAAIYSAKTNEEATQATFLYTEYMKIDPNYLAGLGKSVLKRDVDKATLIDQNGYATDAAVQLVIEIQIVLAQSKMTVSNAPSDGYNSGANKDGVIVGSANAGITGDLKAIQIELPDGTTIWILARCGNIVTIGKSPFPPGDTDELHPKDPSQDVGVNPKVAEYKKDATGGDATKGHQVVTTDNGATVSNGLQNNPAADAIKAEAAARAAAAAERKAYEDAKKTAKVVDTAPPNGTEPPIDPNW
jgi:hypothetical protein